MSTMRSSHANGSATSRPSSCFSGTAIRLHLPAGARRFLTSRLCANQAFVVDREHHAHLGMQFHVEMTPQLVNAWVTDPSGAHEIDEAFERQGGAGVQRAAEIVLNVDERTQRMSRLADRIYQRWLRGVRS